jgi:hypothetical protein
MKYFYDTKLVVWQPRLVLAVLMVRDLKIIKMPIDALSTEALIAIIQLENFIHDQKIWNPTFSCWFID